MKNKIPIVFFILVISCTFTAFGQEQPSEAPVLTATNDGQQVASFRGNGNQTTNSFSLNAGHATFRVQLNWEKSDESLTGGEGRFSVVLQDSSGKDVETVIGTFDYFEGARTIEITKSDKYTLKIDAPGPWNVTVVQ